MKKVGAVKHKLNQVRFRHLKKRLENELRRCPGNCHFNAAVKDPRSPDPVGVCMYGVGASSQWQMKPCDDRFGGEAQAAICPWFQPKKSKDQIKIDFQNELDTLSLAEIAFQYPDMAALIWVLDVDDVPAMTDEDVHPPTDILPHALVPTHFGPRQDYASAPTEDLKASPWWVRLLGLGSW